MRAKSMDKRQTSRFIGWIQRVDHFKQRAFLGARTHFHSDRILNATEKFNVRVARHRGAVANPRHVRGKIPPPFAMRHASRLRLLIWKHQAFMACEKIHAAHFMHGRACQRFHKSQALPYFPRHFLIFVAQRTVLHKIQIPIFRMVQIGEATIHKRADEIQSESGTAVCVDQAVRIGCARVLMELQTVDQVAAVGIQF